MTRFTFFAHVATKESDAVASVIVGLMAHLPPDFLKTLTFDNGKEFAGFAELERALGLKVYFAKPYHSWERRTNENRMVRRWYPKGTDFSKCSKAEISRLQDTINSILRLLLGGLSANQFAASVKAA